MYKLVREGRGIIITYGREQAFTKSHNVHTCMTGVVIIMTDCDMFFFEGGMVLGIWQLTSPNSLSGLLPQYTQHWDAVIWKYNILLVKYFNVIT